MSPDLEVSEASDPDSDIEEAPVGPIKFVVEEGQLCMQLIHGAEEFEDDEELLRRRYGQVLQPLLRRHRATLTEAEADLHQTWAPWPVLITLSVSTRGLTAADVYAIAEDALALANAVEAGGLKRAVLHDMVCAGHSEALVGQKRTSGSKRRAQHYDLKRPAGQIPLARAVARFCNSPDGGIIVVGLTTP